MGMGFDDFFRQVRERGAQDAVRLPREKVIDFRFEGRAWRCQGDSIRRMAEELADGNELLYCIAQYCEPIVDGVVP